jgi:hypothetical protein
VSLESKASVGVVDSINTSGVRLIDIDSHTFKDGDSIYSKSNDCMYVLQIGKNYVIDNDNYVAALNLSGGQWVKALDIDNVGSGGGGGVDPSKLAGGLFVDSSGYLTAPLLADWPVTNTRWYAVDDATGNDAYAGYSDISAADAWTKPKKTLSGLGAIIPRIGNDRKIAILVGGGGQSYADALQALIGNTQGYAANSYVRGTSTNPTAQAVAGSDSIEDATFCGAITATGMNVSGYSCTGSSTATRTVCTKVGGGAPGFSAEPALPFGARIRFDNSVGTTTQAALRNVCRTILRTVASDTLQVALDAPLPATPGVGDTLYIEMPGVNIPATILQLNGSAAIQLVGLQFTAGFQLGNLNPGVSNNRISFCHFVNIVSQFSTFSFTKVYGHTSLGSLTVGGVRLSSTYNTMMCNNSFQEACIVGQATIGRPSYLNMSNQSAFMAGIIVEGGAMGPNDALTNGVTVGAGVIGNSTSTAPIRFLRTTGPAIDIRGCRVSIACCVIVAGSVVGCSIRGTSDVSNQASTIGFPGYIQGEDGATTSDVGLDFNSSSASTPGFNSAGLSRFRHGLGNNSNITGTNGDIRLAGGKIISWSQLNQTGIVDRQGNILWSVIGPSWILTLSGFILGDAGSTTSYLANTGPIAGGSNFGPCEFPTSTRLITRLRFKPEVNTFTTNVVATLYKNGTATTLTVTIPAGSTSVVTDAATSHEVLYADGDVLAVVLSNAGDSGKSLVGMCTLEGPS